MVIDTLGSRPLPGITGGIAVNNRVTQQNAETKFEKNDSVVNSEETYFSPVVRIDPEAQKAFFIYRDRETGEVRQQFPPEQVSDSYLRSEEGEADLIDELRAESESNSGNDVFTAPESDSEESPSSIENTPNSSVSTLI